MSKQQKKSTSKPAHHVADALQVLANARARKTEIRHDIEGAGEVARTKFAAGAAEAKRDVQKHIDEARVKATSKRPKGR